MCRVIRPRTTRPSPTRSETLPHSAAQSAPGGPAPDPSAWVATRPRPRPVGARPLRRAAPDAALLPSRASAVHVSASHRLARRAAAAWRSARAPNTPDSDSCSRAGAGSRTRDTLRAPLAPAATASPLRSADSLALLVYPPDLDLPPFDSRGISTRGSAVAYPVQHIHYAFPRVFPLLSAARPPALCYGFLRFSYETRRAGGLRATRFLRTRPTIS